MRTALAISALASLAFASASCGDDGGGGTDTDTECQDYQDYCEAFYADDLEECDVCGVEAFRYEGSCVCNWLSCVPDLCTSWCQGEEGADGGTCDINCECT